MYLPKNEDKDAALNFHLTAREKRDVMQRFNNPNNQQAMRQVIALLQ